jgi:hypothetical protein
LGRLTDVDVWQEKPTADDLLKARLNKGWQPTPSDLKEGPKVEGYAACLFLDDRNNYKM